MSNKTPSKHRRNVRVERLEQHIEEEVGPMNSVAKADAEVYVEQHEEKVELTKVQREKLLRAKKKKIQRSTTKKERSVSKQLKRYMDK
jgi:hypothetical protein